MHTYDIYEADPAGKLHPTGKTLTLRSAAHSEIMSGIFNLYGFSQYQSYYTISTQTLDQIIKVVYCHDGGKPTWVLIRH